MSCKLYGINRIDEFYYRKQKVRSSHQKDESPNKKMREGITLQREDRAKCKSIDNSYTEQKDIDDWSENSDVQKELQQSRGIVTQLPTSWLLGWQTK